MDAGLVTRFSLLVSRHSVPVSFLLGAVTVLGYAPFGVFPLPVLTLAALLYLWSRAPSPRAAALQGFAYGLGLFLFGVSWVYVSLHDFGAMPAPLAAIATFLFCAFLALLPAGAAYGCVRPRFSRAVMCALLAPAAWTLAEWTRGWILTGFPWLAIGYSQIPASPLAGYAPVVGIYGVTLVTAASAGLLVVLWQGVADRMEGGSSRVASFTLPVSTLAFFALWGVGLGLKQVAWTEPAGAPVTVSLLQGNVAQDQKWREDRVVPTLNTYRRMTESSTAKLIILPETALPLFLQQVPEDYLNVLAAHARVQGGDILLGVPERIAGGGYYNSVVTLGNSPRQFYRKSHLVPFGEFIPLRPLLAGIVGALAIPLQDFSRGSADQRPLAVGGERVAVNICYEDAFGEEIIRQLPEATLLVNVSNVAWFGRSLAPQQHLQISRARAMETGRTMLRATNTGVTGVIDPRGELVAAAPEFTMAAVTREVQGHRGATPYVRWGNYAALFLCLALIASAYALRPRSAA
ncbi:MAG TPA: apolipoprotein N-acyltransferase [Burkholderiales bacterium]|nr:apolipoprotein N-acyltransferase [Burkholderiales bacterium]